MNADRRVVLDSVSQLGLRGAGESFAGISPASRVCMENYIMSFWDTQRLCDRNSQATIIDRFEKTRVQCGAYELSLGSEVYVSGAAAKLSLEVGAIGTIAPGQIAVLITEEYLTLPEDTMGFISLKSSIKHPGLINVSGFHVDPGFKGQLVFTVYNAGTETCAFARGQPMFSIWFAERTGPDTYDGGHQDQRRIPSTVITRLTAEGASPARLDKRLGTLELYVKIYGAVLVAFFLSVATFFVRAGLTSQAQREEVPSQAVERTPVGSQADEGSPPTTEPAKQR